MQTHFFHKLFVTYKPPWSQSIDFQRQQKAYQNFAYGLWIEILMDRICQKVQKLFNSKSNSLSYITNGSIFSRRQIATSKKFCMNVNSGFTPGIKNWIDLPKKRKL